MALTIKITIPYTNTRTTYNGRANYETWNASLWIKNDLFLYNTAKACVNYAENESPWSLFVRSMTNGQIGRHLVQTPDGVRWDNPTINSREMLKMMNEL